jgi:1-deoxyxylulose-5-phosphate synthase
MEYVTLGCTDMKVSRVCLGTVFRSEADEQSCLSIISKAIDLGCNFIDCANVYRDGLSEQFVGRALQGNRDRLVITTKVGAPTRPGINSGSLSRKTILRDVEDSLRRLQTDYIDLYLCHFPDRDTPLEETLRAMDDLVRQGKIRHPGCSNFSAWQLCHSLWTSDCAHLAPFVCNQVAYSLLDRRIEDELIPMCGRFNVALTAYATTSIGLLSGQYRYGTAPPGGSPWALGPYNYRAAMTRQTDEVIRTLIGIAYERGMSPAQVAMAWCLTKPQVASVIIGVDRIEHVAEDLGAPDYKLGAEELERLNNISAGMRMSVRKDAVKGYDAAAPWP